MPRQVRIRPALLDQTKNGPNLFPIGDGFGLFVFYLDFIWLTMPANHEQSPVLHRTGNVCDAGRGLLLVKLPVPPWRRRGRL